MRPRSRLGQPGRDRSSARSAGPTSNRSPTTNRSAKSAIGAVRVAVDRDDRRRRLHAHLVLDRAADAEREVELGLDDLAGLADLLAYGIQPESTAARVAPTAPPSASARSSMSLNPSGSADAAATGDDDPGVLDRDARRPPRRPGRRRGPSGSSARRPRRERLDRARGVPRASAVTTFGRTVMIPRPSVKALSVMSLPPNALISTTGPSSDQVTPPWRWRGPRDRSGPTARPRCRGRPGWPAAGRTS